MTAGMPRARKSDSISGVLERLAAHDPQRTVLVWDNRRISIGALLEEGRRVGSLAELEIVAGDRVALWLPNSPAWLALYLACARLGAIAVAVNTRFRSSEIADILGRSGARLLVLWPDFRHIDFLTILTEADPFALDRLEGIVIFGSAASPELVKGKRTVPYDALNQHSRYTDDRGDGPLGGVISHHFRHDQGAEVRAARSLQRHRACPRCGD